jgi:hypothetical protein
MDVLGSAMELSSGDLLRRIPGGVGDFRLAVRWREQRRASYQLAAVFGQPPADQDMRLSV